MTRWLYSALFYVAIPFVFLRVLWRSLKEPTYRQDFVQRLGVVRGVPKGCVWVHAVSAGETIAARGLIEKILAAGHEVLLSNMTPTGRERARALFGDRVHSIYAPYDLPGSVQRLLKHLNPKALIVIDTELWPNMVAQARRQGLPVYLVNGRLSEKSARGYARIGQLGTDMFSALSHVFAQSEQQAARFRALGAPSVSNAGSIKFDATRPEDFDHRLEALQHRFDGRQVLLGASTHDGEERLLLEAFRELKSEGALLVLAPRHTHRISAVLSLITSYDFLCQRHSHFEGAELDARTQVYLLDTMGELIYFYGVCDVALVGGSLVPNIGGHNPMEPGGLHKPILMGPHRRNIADIAEQFEAEGALITVNTAQEVASLWWQLLENEDSANTMSEAARAVMARNQGAVNRVCDHILPTLE